MGLIIWFHEQHNTHIARQMFLIEFAKQNRHAHIVRYHH